MLSLKRPSSCYFHDALRSLFDLSMRGTSIFVFFQDLSIIGRGKHATLQLPRTEVHTGHIGLAAPDHDEGVVREVLVLLLQALREGVRPHLLRVLAVAQRAAAVPAPRNAVNFRFGSEDVGSGVRG